MSTKNRIDEAVQLYAVWYQIPKLPQNAPMDALVNRGARVHAATAELARYGLQGHTLFFVRSGSAFGVVSEDEDFLLSLPNPMHQCFIRGTVEPYERDIAVV